MEKMQMDPGSVLIVSEKLHIQKMRAFPASPVAPLHRKAKLLIRCPLKGEDMAVVVNLLVLLLIVEDEKRWDSVLPGQPVFFWQNYWVGSGHYFHPVPLTAPAPIAFCLCRSHDHQRSLLGAPPSFTHEKASWIKPVACWCLWDLFLFFCCDNKCENQLILLWDRILKSTEKNVLCLFR